MSVFSKRHRRAIASGQLDISLDERLRGRVWRVMRNHNMSFNYQPDPGDGWTETTDYLQQVEVGLLDTNGQGSLRVGGAKVGFKQWLARCPGEEALDAAELFYLQLEDDSRVAFSADLNRVLGEEDATWRMLDGQFVLLDAVFVHDRIVSGSQETLHSVRFEGAAQEMLSAHHDLIDKDMRGAVHNAGKSFESTMKAALGEEGHMATAKSLIDAMATGSWLDGLPDQLRGGFASQVMLALPWMRNHLGGHGQGRDEQPLPEPYARLAVGLAAVFDEFVVGLAMERDSSLARVTDQQALVAQTGTEAGFFPVSDEDMPF